MIWKVEWDGRARRELQKLDSQMQQEILNYLRQRIAVDADPRRFGKPLSGEMLGLWLTNWWSWCYGWRIAKTFIGEPIQRDASSLGSFARGFPNSPSFFQLTSSRTAL